MPISLLIGLQDTIGINLTAFSVKLPLYFLFICASIGGDGSLMLRGQITRESLMSDNNKLYVGNMSYDTNKAGLEEFFAQAGTVADAIVIEDRMTGRSRGFGFVTMANSADLQKALELNGQDLDGRQLKINQAQSSTGGDRRRRD